MAKIYVCGNAVLFQSEMKLDDLVKIKKYRPEALCVKGGKDNEDLLFVATTAPGCMGDVDADGAIFGKASAEDGKAIITKVWPDMPDNVEEAKNILADKLGAALNYMNQLESVLPGVLEEVEAEHAAVLEAISIG